MVIQEFALVQAQENLFENSISLYPGRSYSYQDELRIQ